MKRTLNAAFAAATAAFMTAAHAGPDDYVHTPAVEYGERELELRLGTATKSSEARQSAAALAFGYGATPWWFTEVYAKFEREGGAGTRFDAFEWENKFQLTEPGQYFVDLGLLVEIERPRDRAEGYELRLGPLLQKDLGPVQANFNVLIERHYRAAEPQVTELGYQWQLKYRWRPELEFGAQGFGEVGQWNDWAPAHAQEHTLGPALFGKLHVAGRQVVKFDAALLFGASRAAADRTVRARIEYEF